MLIFSQYGVKFLSHHVRLDITIHCAHRGRLSNFVRAGKLVSWKNLGAGISKKFDSCKNLTPDETWQLDKLDTRARTIFITKNLTRAGTWQSIMAAANLTYAKRHTLKFNNNNNNNLLKIWKTEKFGHPSILTNFKI